MLVFTANGEVQTNEEATVYVKELGIFLTMKVLEDTPAVLSLGKLCDEHGYTFEWINGENGIRIQCNTENFVPIVVPGLSVTPMTPFSNRVKRKCGKASTERPVLFRHTTILAASYTKLIGYVFENLPAPGEPPAAFLEIREVWHDVQWGLVSPDYRETCRAIKWRGENPSELCNSDSEIWKEVFNLKSSLSRSYTVAQPRNQVPEMHFDKFLDPSTFQCWKTNFKAEVCSRSSFPTDAMLWVRGLEMVESVDDHETSQSIGRHKFPNFEMLDVNTASALKKIITNHHFKKRVNLEERKAQMQDLLWRKSANVIYEYFPVTGAHGAVFEDKDLFSITLQGADIRDFDDRCDQAFSGIISQRQFSGKFVQDASASVCATPDSVVAKYEQEILQDRSRPNYQKLQTMVRTHMDQMFRTRHFKVWSDRFETGVLVKTQKGGMSVLQGEWYQCNSKGLFKRRCLQYPPRRTVSVQREQSSSLAPRPKTRNDVQAIRFAYSTM